MATKAAKPTREKRAKATGRRGALKPRMIIDPEWLAQDDAKETFRESLAGCDRWQHRFAAQRDTRPGIPLHALDEENATDERHNNA